MVSKHNQASQYQGTIDATSCWTAGVWSESIAAPCPICVTTRCLISHWGTLIDILVLIIVTVICGTMVFNFYIIVGRTFGILSKRAVLHTVTQWCHEVVPWRQNLTIRFLTKPTSILQCSCLVCKSGSSRVHALVGHRKWKLQQNKHCKSKQVFHAHLPSWQDVIDWNFS